MSDLILQGVLSGHGNWVTAISTTAQRPDMILSASRDRTLIVWSVTGEQGENFAIAKKRLQGHSHFVQDVAISSDGMYALSASWDRTLRLWDIQKGVSTKRFAGHTHDVMSVAFSPENRQIVSSSRDNTIKVWNTLGECKFTFSRDNCHSDWVNCVRFSPNPENPQIVSGGSDKLVKVFNLTKYQTRANFVGHTNVVNAVTVSPDGLLSASASKDGTCILWNLQDGGHLHTLDAGEAVHCLAFSPNHYWLCAGTDGGFKIWDLETKEVVAEVGKNKYPEGFGESKGTAPSCISLAFSADGTQLYTGWTDSKIRAFAC